MVCFSGKEKEIELIQNDILTRDSIELEYQASLPIQKGIGNKGAEKTSHPKKSRE